MNKATEDAPATVTNDRQKTGSVIGGFRGKLPLSRKRIVLGVIVLIVALVGVVSYSAYLQLNPSVNKVKSTYTGPTDFYLMQPSEVAGNVEPILGISEQDLRKKTLTSRMLPTYEKSYLAAKALVMLGEPKKALEAFKLAEGKLPQAKLLYGDQIDFHYNYAIIAQRNSDKSLAKQQIAKARKILDQSKADAETKDRLNRQLRYFEEEMELS